MRATLTALILNLVLAAAFAQNGYWQQQANYTINVELDAKKHILTGTEKIVYSNNSPDTLHRLFFHIYWNSIKPTSEAAQWVKQNGDILTGKKIYTMSADEGGFQEVKNMTVNGVPVKFEHYESILEVMLNQPVLPNSTAVIELEFSARVPIAVRRAGRNNSSGIDYSMCQWYPKLCRYDKLGWHADPYFGKEFAGTFGDFDVTIVADKKFVIAGTGVLQNKEYLVKGYVDKSGSPTDPKSKTTSWHFIAENVHDFAWAADPDYDHLEKQVDGIAFHFFYHGNKGFSVHWKTLIDNIEKAYPVAKENFGAYPYPQFSFIQAGEGYMEYPMCTFLEAGRSDLVSTAFHEFMHAWYYGIFGTDENMFHWMDEGLTMYGEARLYAVVSPPEGNINREAVEMYQYYRKYFMEEPASTFANYFKSSETYVLAAYYKGQLFMEQLRYIIGEENVKKGLLKYYDEWKFKHPEPNDLVNCMESVSGIELSWYQNYWLYTTKTIDHAIESVVQKGSDISIVLKRNGQIPMPVDLRVVFTDGTSVLCYIPLDLMYGKKPHERDVYPESRIELVPWTFAMSKYEFNIKDSRKVAKVILDPLGYTADIEIRNNVRELAQ